MPLSIAHLPAQPLTHLRRDNECAVVAQHLALIGLREWRETAAQQVVVGTNADAVATARPGGASQ